MHNKMQCLLCKLQCIKLCSTIVDGFDLVRLPAWKNVTISVDAILATMVTMHCGMCAQCMVHICFSSLLRVMQYYGSFLIKCIFVGYMVYVMQEETELQKYCGALT